MYRLAVPQHGFVSVMKKELTRAVRTRPRKGMSVQRYLCG
jgi:hypothetical protein